MYNKVSFGFKSTISMILSLIIVPLLIIGGMTLTDRVSDKFITAKKAEATEVLNNYSDMTYNYFKAQVGMELNDMYGDTAAEMLNEIDGMNEIKVMMNDFLSYE